MQVDNEERKIEYDLTVSVGAGLPNNRAYRYSIVRQARIDKAITNKEYRNYLIKQLGLNIPEIPDSQAEQQEIQIYDEETQKAMEQQAIAQQNMNLPNGENVPTGQNANIEGLTTNGNVSRSYMKGV